MIQIVPAKDHITVTLPHSVYVELGMPSIPIASYFADNTEYVYLALSHVEYSTIEAKLMVYL